MAAEIEHVAQHGEVAAFDHQAPVECLCSGLFLQQRLDFLAHIGRKRVPRQPDEGEQVPCKRCGDELDSRTRPVGQGHHGGGDAGEVRLREADHDVVRQRGQRVDQRLGVMTRGSEIEPGHRRGELAAQHRHLVGRRGEGGAGPHSGVDRQRNDAPLLDHGHDEQVERHAPVDLGQAVGLDDQRCGGLLSFEPGEGALIAVGREQLAGALAAHAEQLGDAPVTLAGGVAEQRQHAVSEPAQQRSAFRIIQPFGVRLDSRDHLRPVADRRAHIAERCFERFLQRSAGLAVDSTGLEVDHRFRSLARFGESDELAGIAPDRNDRMNQEIDFQTFGGDRGGDRIDEERHVAVDHRDAHDAAARRAAQQDRRRALGPHERGFEQEVGGFGKPLGRQGGFARQQRFGHPLAQPACQRLLRFRELRLAVAVRRHSRPAFRYI